MAAEFEWTRERVIFLRRNYGTQESASLAERLTCTVEEVEAQALVLVLRKSKAAFPGKPMPRWTKDEIYTLTQLYPGQSSLELARLLNRSVKSVTSKAMGLGLKKDPSRLREMGSENVSLRKR